MVVIGLNVNAASEIRTKASARLLRNISIAEIHNKLIAMFVDRFELEKEIQKNNPQFDIAYFLTRDYLIQSYCYHEHTHPQMQGYYEKQHGFDKSDLIVIEDEKGGNNEW